MNTTHEMSAEQDMRERMGPDSAAVNVAVAALKAASETADTLLAVIPMIYPGKENGVWTAGQEVVTIHGKVFLGENRPYDQETTGPMPPLHEARSDAIAAAHSEIGSRSGTLGWAVVRPDGNCSVYEY